MERQYFNYLKLWAILPGQVTELQCGSLYQHGEESRASATTLCFYGGHGVFFLQLPNDPGTLATHTRVDVAHGSFICLNEETSQKCGWWVSAKGPEMLVCGDEEERNCEYRFRWQEEESSDLICY